VSGRKLPLPVALNERVSELYDAIERLGLRCSFYVRLANEVAGKTNNLLWQLVSAWRQQIGETAHG